MEPAIAFAVARPPEGRTSVSASPWMTSVGALILRNRRVRLPEAIDRGELAGRGGGVAPAVEGRLGEPPELVLVALEPGRADERERLDHVLDKAVAIRRRDASSSFAVRSCGCPDVRAPVLPMIETSESTRSGCLAATVWAIIAPIDAPTTWARSISR